mmetsp:Transcript_20138/g.43831  ORF Transcript_20138/g.43831 Transcript_20138/m.43831 type:complete len:176 (-) Transcript_20138:291-818(-)
MNRIIIRCYWISFRSSMRLQLPASVSLSLLLFRLLHLRYHAAHRIASSNNTDTNTNDWQFHSSTPPLAERKTLFRPIIHLAGFVLLTHTRPSSRRIQYNKTLLSAAFILLPVRRRDHLNPLLKRPGIYLQYNATRVPYLFGVYNTSFREGRVAVVGATIRAILRGFSFDCVFHNK